MATTRTTKPKTDDPTPDELAEFRAFKAKQAVETSDQKDAEQGDEEQAPRLWYVLDNNFIYPGTEQGDIRIRLQFKFKLLRAIRAKDIDEVDQLIALLDGIGDTKTIAQLDELDALEDIPKIVDGFFTAFKEKNEASVGEASRSSN